MVIVDSGARHLGVGLDGDVQKQGHTHVFKISKLGFVEGEMKKGL